MWEILFAFDSTDDLIKIGEDPILLDNFEAVLNGFLRKKNMDVYVTGSKEEAFDDYMVYGGLPAVTLMETEEQKTNYLITQVNNLYLRDIINRYHLQSYTAIGELLDVISSGISTLTNPRKLSATFASVKQTTISELTVDKYIGHMEDLF